LEFVFVMQINKLAGRNAHFEFEYPELQNTNNIVTVQNDKTVHETVI
jgi:hypothetical protein